MNHNRKIPTLILWLLTIMAVAISSCRHSGKSDEKVIAVSFESQKWLLDRIAGDDYHTVALLPAGTDPEMFDPDMRTMKALDKAQAYLTTSTLGFEKEIGRRIESNYSDLRIFDLTDGIDILEHSHNVASESHHHEHDHEVGGDPHLLSSIKNARIVSRNILAALVSLNPASSEIYCRRYDELDRQLTELDQKIDSLLTQSGRKGASFVVTHPSLSYYARDYGMTQIPLEQDGKEPSPRQLEQRLIQAKDDHPVAFFYEKGGSGDRAQEIGRFLGLSPDGIYLNGTDFTDVIWDVTEKITGFSGSSESQSMN